MKKRERPRDVGLSTSDRHARLAMLGQASYCSHSGLEKVLGAIEKEGLPKAFSRSTQYRARKAMCAQRTPYGVLVEERLGESAESGGRPVSVPIQNPLAALHHAARTSASYAQLLRKAFAIFPPTVAAPWDVILYQDGVNPSDGLAKNHSRKSAVFYWSFMQFGLDGLAHEEAWCTVSIGRVYGLCKSLDGHVTQLTSIACNAFFDNVDMQRVGVRLSLHGGSEMHIFACLGCFLADEPALKEMLSCKGHSGTKPCCLCINCVLHKQPRSEHGLHDRSDYAVSMVETPLARFKLHTDESLRATVAKLHSYKGTVGTGHFAALEQIYGFTYCKHTVLLQEHLNIRAVRAVMFDWTHGYLCDGLGDEELGSCMKHFRMEGSPCSYEELGKYVEAWSFPKQWGNLNRVFNPTANANNLAKGKFSSTASELATLAPVLFLYFSRVCAHRHAGDERFQTHIRSMIAVLQVILMLMAMRTGSLTAETLAVAIVGHVNLYKAAYGVDAMRPKHHYVLHLPMMFKRWGMLVGTLVCERKHRVIKRYTKGRLNLTEWDRGSIEEVTVHQLWEQSRAFLRSGHYDRSRAPKPMLLLALQELYPELENIVVTHSIKTKFGLALLGDAVFYKTPADGTLRAGELVVNFKGEDKPEEWSAITVWEELPSDSQMLAHFRVSRTACKVLSEWILAPTTHRWSTDRASVHVFVPDGLR